MFKKILNIFFVLDGKQPTEHSIRKQIQENYHTLKALILWSGL